METKFLNQNTEHPLTASINCRLMECQALSNVLMEPLILTHSNQHAQDSSSSSLQGVTRNKHRV